MSPQRTQHASPPGLRLARPGVGGHDPCAPRRVNTGLSKGLVTFLNAGIWVSLQKNEAVPCYSSGFRCPGEAPMPLVTTPVPHVQPAFPQSTRRHFTRNVLSPGRALALASMMRTSFPSFPPLGALPHSPFYNPSLSLQK